MSSSKIRASELSSLCLSLCPALCSLWFILSFANDHPANQIATDDPVDHIHAANHAPENCVAAIQVWLRLLRHDPLRPARVFARQRHPNRGSVVRNLIDFTTNLIARPAILIAAWIAGLNYKVGDNARNCLAVEITFFRKLNEIVDRQGYMDEVNGR